MTAISRWQSLYEELKRRRVFRVATLYLVVFWPVVQIVDILSPALDLPDTVMRYLVIAFAAGFPAAVIFAWIFDINKDGIAVTGPAPVDDKPLIGVRSEMVLVGALLILVSGLFLVQLQMDDTPQTPSTNDNPLIGNTRFSVAVLPFVPFSDNPTDQQFADGLTEELLNVLSRVKSLRVAARTSSFAYRGVNKNVTAIGEELNVGIILEGSVRRNDVTDTIRVTAQLIDTPTGSHLWSKTYDRKFSDIFQIQDDIAGSVVDELQITLLGTEREKIQSRSSANPEAMVAYGLGQSELDHRTEQSLLDAARFFNKAIELDPNYVDAYTGLATAQTLMVSYEFRQADEYLPLAQQSLEQAFALDPESGSAWATQGLLYLQKMDKKAALIALEKAMNFNPSHAMAHMWYAGLQASGNDRLDWYQRAYELDPKSPVIGFNVASILLDHGRDLEAMQIFGQVIDADPNYHGAYALAARLNESRGRMDEAINQWQKAYELSPNVGYASSIASLYIDISDFERAQEWIQNMGSNLPDKLQLYSDWLQISSYASVDRLAEAEHLLQKKITTAEQLPGNFHFEEAAFAAYFLGDEDRVLHYFEQIDDELSMHHFNNSFRLNVTLAASNVYRLKGRLEKSEELLQSVEGLIDEYNTENRKTRNDVWYLLAQIAVIRGEKQMALVHLQRAIDEGWRSHWQTRVEPILANLHEEPAFQSMIAGLETRMDIMREQLTMASAFDSGWSG